MSQIKWIIFDMCGVLIEDAYQHLFRRVSDEKGYDYLTFMDEIREPLDKTMQGLISEREFFKIIIKKFDLNINSDELYNNLMTGFLKIEETWDIVKELKENYNLAILSDMGKEMVTQEMKSLNLNKYFNKVIFSSDTGYKKPQEELFKLALKQLDANPQECLFIDDKKRNTDAASKLCINTITFKNSKQLKKELNMLFK